LNVEDLLDVGKENAISYPVLMRRLGIRHRRGLYKAIAEARRRDVPILSDGKGGYYIADVKNELGEIRAFNKRMKHLGVHVLAAAKGTREIEKKAARPEEDQRQGKQMKFTE
jgi:hypothetical protein